MAVSEIMIDTLISFLCATEGVDALVLAGSRSASIVDKFSDYDLYVYGEKPLGLDVRQEMADHFASKAEVGNSFFDEGDEMFLKDGTAVDLMYRSLDWAEQQVRWVWQTHHASVGYSTAFIHNLKFSRILCDRSGRFAHIQELLDTPYPKELIKAILEKNHPLLRSKLMASYYEQIEHAQIRNDMNSVVHRTSALLASYFDVLFAINAQTHPGEKKLVALAKQTCSILPADFEKNIEQVMQHLGDKDLLVSLDVLLDELDVVLKNESWI